MTPLRRALYALWLWLLVGAAAAAADELRLSVPAELAENGFLKHILPRFKLKHRVTVVPVAPGEFAEMSLSAAGEGTRVFADGQGAAYRLAIAVESDGTARFRDWLTSTPGKSAVESFPRGGPPLYTTDLPEAAVEETVTLSGDAALGSRLALAHCGRCHVVDHRNRMGGIGSTPSFAAMRGRRHWVDLFRKYWSENPHPSFTEVVGVTEPFGKTNVTHIAPVQITLDEIDAIVAFVGTLTPKDLGRPVPTN